MGIKNKNNRTHTRTAILMVALFFAITLTTHTHANTIAGTANAEIRQAIQISEVQALNFGIIAAPSGASETISIGFGGTLSNGGTGTNGLFNVTGAPNAAISITFQDGILSNGGASMALGNLTHDASTTPAFNAAGTLLFQVGADLEIAESQESGAYSGSYQITVNYQ